MPVEPERLLKERQMSEKIERNAVVDDSEEEIDLSELFRYFKEGCRRFLIYLPIIAVVLTVFGCVIEKKTYVPKYSTKITVAVSSPLTDTFDDGTGTKISNYSSANDEQLQAAFVEIVNSGLFSRNISNELGEAKLNATIRAERVGEESNYVNITVSSKGGDPTYPEQVIDLIEPTFISMVGDTLGPVSVQNFTPGGSSTPAESNSLALMIVKYCIISVLIWLVIVLVYSLTRDRVLSREDMNLKLGRSPMAVIPPSGRRSDAVRQGLELKNKNTNPMFAESVKLLAAKMTPKSDEGGRVCMFTSANPGEGKTTVSINVACAAAMKGKKVVLVDGDLRRQDVRNVLDIKKPTCGIVEFASGAVKKSEFMYYDERFPFCVVSGSVTTDYPAEIIHSKRIDSMFGVLKEMFDVIIVDTPPCAVISDAVAMAKYADDVFFIVREDYSEVKEINQALENMAPVKDVTGFVLNVSESDQGRVAYGRYGKYGYGKYGRYGKYGYGKYGHYGYGKYGYGSHEEEKEEKE